MRKAALTVVGRSTSPSSDGEVRGLESAHTNLVAYLEEQVGTVKVDVIDIGIAQLGTNKNEPFEHLEYRVSDGDLGALADQILQACSDDIQGATNQGEIHAKIIYSVRLAGHNKRKNFPLECGVVQGAFDENFSPTLLDITKQQMSHNQEIMRVAVGGAADQMRSMAAQNALLVRRVETLEKERADFLKLYEELLSRQHERTLAEREQQQASDRLDGVVDTFKNAAAPLVNKLIQQKLMPETVSPIEGMVVALMSTVTPEQVQQMTQSGLFSTAQQHNFLQLLSAVAQHMDEQKLQANGHLPQGPTSVTIKNVTPNPAPGSTGGGQG